MNISTIYLPSASLSSIFNGTPYLVFSASSLTQSIQIEQIVYKLVYNSQPYNASYDSGLYFYETASYGQSYVDNLYSGFINIDKNRVVTSTSGWTLNSASLYIKFEGNQAPTQGNTDLYIDIYYNTLNIDDRDPIFSFDKKGQFTEALEQGSAVTGSGRYSHAQGVSTYARASGSHSEGQNTTAYGNYSHAEGQTSVASGSHSHAEGSNTNATGRWSHTEGKATITIGDYSHAEGDSTVAYGDYSHTSGQGTIASGSAQTVVGQYNKRGNTTDLFVVGGGTGDADANRKDIFNVSTTTIAMSGSVNISGSILFTPPTSPNFNGEIVRFGSGTLTTGQLYFLSSSGTWSLANANSTGSSTGMLGIAVGSSPSTNGLLIRGYAASSSYTYGTGSIVYMATGSGIMTATSPSSSNHVVRVLGYQTTLSNTIYFDPDKTWVTLA